MAIIVIPRHANQKEIGEILVPPWSGNQKTKREGALTPDTLVLGKVGFVISLLCSRNRCIVGVARQGPEPHGLTWERLES